MSHAVIGHAREAFRERVLPVPYDEPIRMLLAATFCRASATCQAAVLLVGSGFGLDAQKLGRSVLEDAHVAAWLASGRVSPAEASERASAFRAVQELREDEYPEWVTEEMKKLVERYFPDEQAKRGSWTGRGPAKMRTEVRESWPDDSTRARIVDALDALAETHWLAANAAVHNSPRGWQWVADGVIAETGEPVFLVGPTWLGSARALDLTVMSLGVLTDVVLCGTAGGEAANHWAATVGPIIGDLRTAVRELQCQELERRASIAEDARRWLESDPPHPG